jgi:sec-independent protein translocase protein TatB
MFDIGFSEILLVAIAALIAVGPKDLPEMLFKLGRFARRIKMFMNGIRNEYADIMHEAEVEHYRKQINLTEDKPKVSDGG